MTLLCIGETSPVTITFSEVVTGFTNADLTVANGALSPVASSDGGTHVDRHSRPLPTSPTRRTSSRWANTGVTDAAGNSGRRHHDLEQLRARRRSADGDRGRRRRDAHLGETSLVTLSFSEPVTDLSNADLAVENGTLTPVSTANGGITWTATLTPTTGIADPTNVIVLDDTGFVDLFGNPVRAPPRRTTTPSTPRPARLHRADLPGVRAPRSALPRHGRSRTPSPTTTRTSPRSTSRSVARARPASARSPPTPPPRTDSSPSPARRTGPTASRRSPPTSPATSNLRRHPT